MATLFVLMNSSIWFDRMSLGWFTVHIKGSQVRISKVRCSLVHEDFSANTDEMPHYVQGSHRHEKYLYIQECLEKSLKIKFALKST